MQNRFRVEKYSPWRRRDHSPFSLKRYDLSESDDESASSISDSEEEDSEDVGPLMLKLLDKQSYTDVTFFSKSTKESFSAHRAVLAAKCAYFEPILYGDQMYLAKGMTMKIPVSEVSFPIFKSIVEYIYGSDIDLTDENVIEVLATAQRYSMEDLVDECNTYILCMDLTEDNVCSILHSCNNNNIEDLKSRCIRFIKENTRQVLESTDFEKCSFSIVSEICQFDSLSLNSEVELLDAVCRWLDVQPGHTKKQLSKSLMKYIRFLNFTIKEYIDSVKKHPELLQNQDGFTIMYHLEHRTPESLRSLPEWCSRSVRSFPACHKEIRKNPSQPRSGGSRIRFTLKPSNETRRITDLTSQLHLKNVKGIVQKITSIKFSFNSSKDDGILLASIEIMIKIKPNGPKFRKNHKVKSKESTCVFSKGIKVFRGQTVQIEADCEIKKGCQLLQFDSSQNDPEEHFQVSLSSQPKRGNLNFISEVEYET